MFPLSYCTPGMTSVNIPLQGGGICFSSKIHISSSLQFYVKILWHEPQNAYLIWPNVYKKKEGLRFARLSPWNQHLWQDRYWGGRGGRGQPIGEEEGEKVGTGSANSTSGRGEGRAVSLGPLTNYTGVLPGLFITYQRETFTVLVWHRWSRDDFASWLGGNG